jgi:hypothetical protein
MASENYWCSGCGFTRYSHFQNHSVVIITDTGAVGDCMSFKRALAASMIPPPRPSGKDYPTINKVEYQTTNK